MDKKTKGVNYHKTHDRWVARIYRNGKMHNLGTFYTESEATEARLKAQKVLDTLQPKETAAERKATREREKVLKQFDTQYK